MNEYLAILKARLSVLFQYRAAAFAGLTTQFFWGFVKSMIMTAFYAHSVSKTPITLVEAINFIWIGQALLSLLPWNIDKEIEVQIKNGNVAYELIRPLNLYWLWFSRSLAMRLTPTILRSIPLFLIAGFFFDLTPPVSWSAGIVFTISLVCSAILSSAITTLVIISVFWTISGEGILRLLPGMVVFFSGMVVPLPLFPDWMQPFLSLQPFRGIVDIPSRLYTGVIPAHEAFFYLGFQLGWALLLIVLGKKLINYAIRHFVVQGG